MLKSVTIFFFFQNGLIELVFILLGIFHPRIPKKKHTWKIETGHTRTFCIAYRHTEFAKINYNLNYACIG